VILPDVNVLVYAFRPDATDHAACRAWLRAELESDRAFGVSELVLSGVVRVLTHPRVFRTPDPLDDALAYVAAIRRRPNCVPVHPGARHWDIFSRLCIESGAKGNLVADAYLAALAIESGCTWVTTDRDFSRFPDLDWRHPLSGRRVREPRARDRR
jgi:toxin-antitoxin system PIN domain toxin